MILTSSKSRHALPPAGQSFEKNIRLTMAAAVGRCMPLETEKNHKNSLKRLSDKRRQLSIHELAGWCRIPGQAGAGRALVARCRFSSLPPMWHQVQAC